MAVIGIKGARTVAEIYKRRDGYGFRMRATRNGRILSSSEAYTRPSDAARGARRAHPFAPTVKRQGKEWVRI
jgi:hypothetical protein